MLCKGDKKNAKTCSLVLLLLPFPSMLWVEMVLFHPQLYHRKWVTMTLAFFVKLHLFLILGRGEALHKETGQNN